MEKNEIEKILKEKYDDEYTIKMFTNFVLEFQECFSDIINTEEVINRIKKNVLGNIVIADELANKKLDGRYAIEDGLDKDGSLAEKLNLIKARSENRRNREELSL